MCDLNRFVQAQQLVYHQVVAELENGHKQSHWMWYIFPQIAGLGRSSTARYFTLSSLHEAREYLGHPLLGSRLYECSRLVLQQYGRLDACQIFGDIDAIKFRSSMTLFSLVDDTGVFTRILEKFFNGDLDPLTLDRVK